MSRSQYDAYWAARDYFKGVDMELIQWANGKGYTLLADDTAEFELLKQTLNDTRYFGPEVEVDESVTDKEV